MGTAEQPMVDRNVLKHELVHSIIWNYLSGTERTQLLNVVADKYGITVTEDNLETLEEFIADEFITYSSNPQSIVDQLKVIFKKIFRALGLLGLHYKELNTFFRDITSGVFTTKSNKNVRVTRLMEKKIRKRFGSMDNYINAKNYLLETINALTQFTTEYRDTGSPENNITSFVPYTFDEAINIAKKQIAARLKMFEEALTSTDKGDQTTRSQLQSLDAKANQIQSSMTSMTDPMDIAQAQLQLNKIDVLRSGLRSKIMKELNPDLMDKYNVVRSLNNEDNFNTIIDYLYPNASLYVATEVTDDPRFGNTLEGEEAYNHSDEISSKEDIDLRINIISRVKQILGTIKYKEDNEDKYVPFNMAYAILLKVMGNFDLTAKPKDQLNYIDRFFDDYGTSPMVTAIKNKIKFIIINSYPTSREVDIPFLQFKSDNVAVLDTLEEPVRFTSIDTILYNIKTKNDARYVVYEKQANETQKEFMLRIYKDFKSRYAERKDLGLMTNNSSFLATYRRFVNLNILANLHTSLVSMRERIPYVAERRYRNGNLVFDYYPVRDAGSNSVYTSQIKESLLIAVRNGFSGPIPKKMSREEAEQKIAEAEKFREKSRIFSFAKDIRTNISTEDKVGLIKSFINALDNRLLDKALKNNPNLISKENVAYVNELYNSLSVFLKTLNQSSIETDPTEFIISKEVKFTNQLSERLSKVDEELAPVNYISGDGKGRYKFGLSSWGMEVFKKLSSSAYTTDFLAYFNDAFYRSNIFLENTTRIIRYFDHDSAKYKGLDTSAVLHKNETPNQWFSRNMNHMFLGALINNNFTSYYQQVYTISDKPNILGAQVQFIEPNEYESIMRKMIRQEAYRNHNLVGKVANFTPDRSYLVGVSKALKNPKSQEEINERYDEFYKGMEQIVDSVLDHILNNKIKLHGELSGKMNRFLSDEEKATLAKDPLYQQTLQELFGNLTKDSFNKLKESLEEDEDSDVNQSDQEFGLESTDLTKEAIKDEANVENDTFDQTYDQYYAENMAKLRKYLRPMARSLAYNFYINSHQLTQMVAGDLAFYKTGSESYDIIKRMSIVFAPGKSGAVNDTYYLPKKTRVAVMEDLREFITPEEAKQSQLPEIEGDKYDSTDGQVYMTPAYFERLKLSQGAESNQGYVLKPVFFGIGEDGVPRSLKCSVIVLTDELIDQFPGLRRMRELMELNNLDMTAFESAVKMGAPAKLTRLFKRDANGKIIKNSDGSNKLLDEDLAVPIQIEEDSIIELDTRNFRLQFNPAKKVIGKVTNPSQMTYMGAINENTIDLVDSILERNGKIIKYGRTIVNRTFRLFNGKPTKSKGITRRIVKNKLISTLANINGSEAEADILDNPNASLNLPMIVNKMINNISSIFQKNTVDIKIKGAKLNLQSEFGTFGRTVTQDKPRLKWRDKNGFTEVYVSEELLKELGLNVGDVVADKGFRAMGFRLPSSGLHSGIAMVIKGTYPSPDPTRTNVIIAPSRIVHVHGSDYDIDSLSVIVRSRTMDVFQDSPSINLGAMLDKAFGIEEYVGNGFINDLKPTQVLGFTEYNPNNPDVSFNPIMINYEGNDLPLEIVIELAIERLQARAKAIISNTKMDPKDKGRQLAELIGNNKVYESSLEYRLIKVYQAIQKNKIVDDFVNLLVTDTSRKWGDMPISMERFNVPKVETREVDQEQVSTAEGLLSIVARMSGKEIKDGNWRSVLYPPIDPSNIVHQGTIHRNSTSGLVIRGAGANAIKAFAYSILGAKTSYFERIGNIEDVLTVEEAKALSKTPQGREKLKLYKRVREVVKLNPEFKVSFNGAIYNTMSTVELESDGSEEGNTVPKTVVVGFDSNGNPIRKVYSIWETLDSLINAAIDNVKEQIIYLINLTSGTASEYFTAIMLGIPMDTIVRFMMSPSLYELSFSGDIKNIEKYNSLYTNVSETINTLLTDMFFKELGDPALKELFYSKNLTPEQLIVRDEINEQLKDFINTRKSKDGAIFLEAYTREVEENEGPRKGLRDGVAGKGLLSDEYMEKSAIFINKYIADNNLGNMTNLTYDIKNKVRNNSLEDPGAIYLHLMVQLSVMEQYKVLSSIGNKIFTAQNSLNVIREFDPTYQELKDKLDSMLSQVSSFGGDRAILDYFNKNVLTVLNAQLGTNYQEISMGEVKQFMDPENKKKKKKKKKEESTEEEVLTPEEEYKRLMMTTLIKFMDSPKGSEAGNRNAINQLLRGIDSMYSTASRNWPFYNSSLLSIPNIRESFITVVQLTTFLENLIIKHSLGMNKMTEYIANRLGSKSSFASKYKVMEDIKNQFMGYFLSSSNVPLAGYVIDMSLGDSKSMKDWVNDLKEDIISLRKYLREQGKPNKFLDSIEFSYDKNSKSVKIVFVAHKKNDPEVEAELKSAFEDLGNMYTKKAIDLLTEEQKNKAKTNKNIKVYKPEPRTVPPGNPYSDISIRLIKYLLVSKGLDFGRVSYSTLLPDSFYTAISETIETEMDEFTSLDFKPINGTEWLNEKFVSIMDDFINQYAINNASKLKMYDKKKVVLTDNQEEGYLPTENNFVHYDLLIKSREAPEFVTYKYGKETRVYRRFAQFAEDKATPLSAYRFIGYSNFNRHYTLTVKNKRNGYYGKDLLNYPIVRLANEAATSFTYPNKSVPFKVGTQVITVSANTPGINNPRKVLITNAKVQENDVLYEVKVISDGIIDTSFNPRNEASIEGRAGLGTNIVSITDRSLSSSGSVESNEDSRLLAEALKESRTPEDLIKAVEQELDNMASDEVEVPPGEDLTALDEVDGDTMYMIEPSNDEDLVMDFPANIGFRNGIWIKNPMQKLEAFVEYFSSMYTPEGKPKRSLIETVNRIRLNKEMYRMTEENAGKKFRDIVGDVIDYNIGKDAELTAVDEMIIRKLTRQAPTEMNLFVGMAANTVQMLSLANKRLKTFMPVIYELLNTNDALHKAEYNVNSSQPYDIQRFVDQLLPYVSDPATAANLRELIRINPGVKLELSKVLHHKAPGDPRLHVALGLYRAKTDTVLLSLGGSPKNVTDSQWANQIANTLTHELAHRSTSLALQKYYPIWQNRKTTPKAAAKIPIQIQNIFRAYQEMKLLSKTLTKEELRAMSVVKDNVKFVVTKKSLEYAFSNIYEFTAHMYTDPVFKNVVEVLSKQMEGIVDETGTNLGQNLIQKLKEWFNKVLEFLLGRQLVFTADQEDRASVLEGYNSLYVLALHTNAIRNDKRADILVRDIDEDLYQLDEEEQDEEDADEDTPREEQVSVLNKILQSPNVNGVMLESDTNGGVYRDSVGKAYNRLTEFVSDIFFSSMSTKVREPEYYATRDFADRGIPTTGTISKKVDNGKEQLFTFDQLVEYHRRKSNNYKSWGKAAHAYIELLLTSDADKKQQISNKLSELIKPMKDENGNQISDQVDLSAMEWLEGKDKNVTIGLREVLRAAGVNIDLTNPEFNQSLQSRSIPELPIVIPGLDLGTTIDNLFVDPDGTYSILDWKTGALLSDFNNPEVMKWGANEGINLTKLNKAKLEVVMRMLAIKLSDSEAKFKNMSVVWIGNQGRYKVHNIDIQPYLNALSEYMKSENPTVFNAYNAKGLFDSKNYLSNNKYQTTYEESISKMDLQGRIA